MFKQIQWVSVLALLVGCNNISDDTPVEDLTDDEVETLCDELAGEDREIVCSEGGIEVTLTIEDSSASCVENYTPSDYEGCDVTVGDIRSCDDAYQSLSDEEICGLETGIPSECESLFECSLGL